MKAWIEGARLSAAALARRLWSTRDGRVAVILLGAFFALSFVVGPMLVDPNASDFALSPAADGGPPHASLRHPLGVDPIYRDELSRLAAGGRVSLAIAVCATALATIIGLVVGVGAAALAKANARWADGLVMRTVDVLIAFPFLLLVTLVGVLVGRAGATTMILVLGLTGWTGMARIVRARAVVLLEADFVLGARAIGASPVRIALSHVLPNVTTTAIALAASLAGSMILAEAVLSYLTVGLAPPTPSWGRMLHESESFLVLRPSLVAMPAAGIVFTLLAFHRLGEAMRRVTASEAAPTSWFDATRLPVDVVFGAAALGLVVLLPRAELAAPPPSSAAPAAPVRGGVLKLATSYSAVTLDPALASDEMGITVGRLVFGRLVDIDEKGELVPGLTTSIAWSDRGTTLRLEIAHDAMFQDGSPVRAGDVKRSIERAFAPKVPTPAASHFTSIVGFSEFHDGKAPDIQGILAESDSTLAIRLKEPNATLPSLLSTSFVAPVCPTTPYAVAETTVDRLCGAGPFKITSFESEEGVVLERHDRYLGGALPYLDGIRIFFRVRPQVQRYRFERGELDLVRELSSSDAALFRGDARYDDQVRFVRNLRTSAIFMNTERPPFDNVWLRRAVALAVDPGVLTRLRPDMTTLVNVVPPGVPGRADDAPKRRHDITEALEAMERAGYAYDPKTGKGGYPEPIEYLTIPDSFEQVAAEIYQQQLARVGIRIVLRLVSSYSFLSIARKRGATQMGWCGWQADYPDPMTFFDPNLVSSAIGEVSQNYSFFANADVDAKLEAARSETNPARRRALFAEAEAIVQDLAPLVPTTTPSTIEVRQPWLHGYEPTALTSLDFTRAYLARERPQ